MKKIITYTKLSRFIRKPEQTPEEKLIETIMTANAQFSHDKMSEKIKRGLARKKANQNKDK